MACLSFVTAIFTSFVVAVLETVGVIMCCRFADEIGTFVLRTPKSLVENIRELGEVMAEIKAMSPSEEIDKWISEVEEIVEEARLVLLPESGSSSDIDEQQSSCCFGYNERLPCELQRTVKNLIVKGQGIMAASPKAAKHTPTNPCPVEGTTSSQQTVVEHSRNISNIEEATTKEKTLEQAVEHNPSVPCLEEGTTSLRKTVETTCDVPEVKEGNIEKKPLEQAVKQTAGFPITEADSTDVEKISFLEPIPKKEKMGQEPWKQKVEHIVGVPNIEEYRTMRRTLSEVMDMLGDNGIRKIGIWGPGGVGKTTLVHTLYNKLKNTSSRSLHFSLVILISVTRDIDPNNMQKAIAAGLNLKTEEGLNTKEVANQICRELQKEKFLLILDDVWEYIDLSRIGIPENQKGSKIILTTRILEVCKKMEAEVIKLNYLSYEESWELLSQQVGGAVYAERITPLSYDAACKECGGLPLALVSVGSFMRGELDMDKWEDVIKKLQNCIPFNDTISEVYKSFKLSYDSLGNDNLKSCFLYCSLFPKRSSIIVRELVECWLAENLVDNNQECMDAFSEGIELIGKLRNYSLLEEGESEGYIRMNDMAVNVARWIARSEGKSLVFSRFRISNSPDVILPMEVDNLKWISFMEGGKLAAPECVTNFPNATTIIIDGGKIAQVAVLEKLLQGSGELRVLNIKNLWEFSVSLIHSYEIRALLLMNFRAEIKELPYLPNLMVIDFCWCRFLKLPGGIERLICLKVLNLSYTYMLRSIGEDVICKLEQLEVLDMRGSSYRWPTKKRNDKSRNATLQDLSRLTYLKEVYVELADVEGSYEEFEWMEKLKSFVFCYRDWMATLSDFQCREKIIRIWECRKDIGSFILHAEKLHLYECHVDEMLLEFSTSEKCSSSKLKSLFLEDCYIFDESTEIVPNYSIFLNLEELQLSGDYEKTLSFYRIVNAVERTFTKLKSLEISGWRESEYLFSSEGPHMKLPALEKITIGSCYGLTKIFKCDPTERQAAFPNLKELELAHLPWLQSLSNSKWHDQWTSLEILIVIRCPELQMLPRMSSIKEIRGSAEWWNNVKWDSEETRSFMKQRFKPRSDPPSHRLYQF